MLSFVKWFICNFLQVEPAHHVTLVRRALVFFQREIVFIQVRNDLSLLVSYSRQHIHLARSKRVRKGTAIRKLRLDTRRFESDWILFMGCV